MDWINIVLITALFANFGLAILSYFKSEKRRANFLWSLVIGSVLLWIISMILYREASPQADLLWCKVLYVSAALIPISFLLFSFYFPRKWSISKLNRFLLILPPVAIMLLTLLSETVVQEVIPRVGKENKIVFGPLYSIYGFYIAGYLTWGLRNLFKEYLQTSKELIKKQIRYMLLGTAISIGSALIFNLVLPGIGIFKLNWLGQVTTLFLVTFVSYAIAKYNLLQTRIVLTDILVVIIASILLIQVIIINTFWIRIVSIIVLSLFLVLGYILVRSVLREIRYRESLEEAYQRLKRLDQAKTEFVSIASHQLRTPLTTIKGYISMILEGNYGEVPKKVKEPMKNVFKSNERLINLVNDLLNVSRIESGKLELDLEQASLEKLISEVVEELQLKAEDKDVEIRWEPSQDLPDIRIDYDKIRQVVLNIIDNAISYTEQGEIVVKAEQKDSKVKITISDTGEGMTQQEIEHLFDRFTRGQAGNQLNTKGVGLGLYVGKKFVDMHGGEIWAESEGRSQGSTFHITLPLNPKYE